jgi:hypothetical protein
MRTMTRVTARNVVVIPGAWYLVSYLLVPVVIVADWLIGRWNLYVPMPAVWFTAALACGVIAAWLIDSEHPGWWALALTAFVFLTTSGSVRWFQPSTMSQRAVQVVESALAALVAGLAFMYLCPRVRRNATAA